MLYLHSLVLVDVQSVFVRVCKFVFVCARLYVYLGIECAVSFLLHDINNLRRLAGGGQRSLEPSRTPGWTRWTGC